MKAILSLLAGLVSLSILPAQSLPSAPEVPKMQSYQPMSPTGLNTTKPQANTSFHPIQIQSNTIQAKKADELTAAIGSLERPEEIYLQLNADNYTLRQESPIPSKSLASIRFVQELLIEVENNDFKSIPQLQLPKLNHSEDYKHFENAFEEIENMLQGQQKLNLKRAIYLTENAWYGGLMPYEEFSQFLEQDAQHIRNKMRQEGLPLNNVQAINYMTHQYISDTLEIPLAGQEKVFMHFPKNYDFNDPFGKSDASKLFVSKLMYTNSGQCKSLPLYFLALVESLGGEAYLSFSSSHSFIKCKNEKGQLFNIELTNGMLTSDSWVVASGYVKAEAIRSGIYLDTLNKKQVIANCLVDLAKNYRYKYGKPNAQMGYDDFNLKCINLALKYHPNNLYAILEKSNYYSVLLNYMGFRKGYEKEEEYLQDLETLEVYLQRNKLYALTDGLGYESMPEERYKEWLLSLEEERQQQEHQKQLNNFSILKSKN